MELARQKLRDRTRQLRNEQTDAEAKLWARLRARQISDVKFRRQHPIGPYVADFCCVEHRLIIEIDGGQHAEQMQSDQHRTGVLKLHGFRVLRFWNNEVLANIEAVLEQIYQVIEQPSPFPLPKRARVKEDDAEQRTLVKGDFADENKCPTTAKVCMFSIRSVPLACVRPNQTLKGDQSRLPIGWFLQLLLGRVSLGFV